MLSEGGVGTGGYIFFYLHWKCKMTVLGIGATFSEQKSSKWLIKKPQLQKWSQKKHYSTYCKRVNILSLYCFVRVIWFEPTEILE